MVTYSLRRAKPQVRFLAPHPIFVLLAVLLLSVSAAAVDHQDVISDIDHYAAAPGPLVVASASSDSLARVVGGDIFGVYWSTFMGDGQIVSIDGVSMRDRADGVQDLATATYKTFQGVESAISSSSSSIEGLLINIIAELDNVSNHDNLYARLLALYNQQNQLASDYRSFWSAFLSPAGDLYSSVHSSGSGINLSGSSSLYSLLVSIDNAIVYSGVSAGSYLASSGRDAVGFLWLPDRVSNGFLGLASLLSGSDSHRGNWVWLNQSGYEGNGDTSLMDMVGEGFLGLSSLLTNAEPGEVRLSWMYVSPDDGLTGTQLKHDTLFSFLGSFASGVQNPLARLAYVLADLDDIAFKQQEKPNMDAVKDSFFGDGEGAVNPDQIKDAAGISSAAKDAFGGAGSPGDAFTAINDSQSFWFFSQEVADALDTVNAPALVSEEEDDFMDQFVQDEDGFYSLIDLSPWDVRSYLGG